MTDKSVMITCEASTSYDVVTNSGYLLEAFMQIQQSGGSLVEHLKDQKLTVLPCEGQPREEIKCTLVYNGTRAIVTESGNVFYHTSDGWCSVELL